MTKEEHYNKGFDDGLQEGLKTTDFSDAYWLRSFAGQAMSKMFADNTAYSRDVTAGVKQCVVIAQALLAEVKKYEANND